MTLSPCSPNTYQLRATKVCHTCSFTLLTVVTNRQRLVTYTKNKLASIRYPALSTRTFDMSSSAGQTRSSSVTCPKISISERTHHPKPISTKKSWALIFLFTFNVTLARHLSPRFPAMTRGKVVWAESCLFGRDFSYLESIPARTFQVMGEAYGVGKAKALSKLSANARVQSKGPIGATPLTP